MSDRKKRYEFQIDPGGIKKLPPVEVNAILRAADELIGAGGRTLLAKILKGSKEHIILKLNLDECPVYGFYSSISIPEITKRIDWMIVSGYLYVEYSGKLPVIVFSPAGWEIEKENRAREFLNKLESLLENGDYRYVTELKDRNRGMILLLIEMIMETKNPGFIPLLRAWQFVDYNKVKLALRKAIVYLKPFQTTDQE